MYRENQFLSPLSPLLMPGSDTSNFFQCLHVVGVYRCVKPKPKFARRLKYCVFLFPSYAESTWVLLLRAKLGNRKCEKKRNYSCFNGKHSRLRNTQSGVRQSARQKEPSDLVELSLCISESFHCYILFSFLEFKFRRKLRLF